MAAAVRQSLHIHIVQASNLPITPPPGVDENSPPFSAQTPDSIMFSVLCMHDYASDEPGLLSFKKNEILDIVKRDDTGWWAAMPKGGTVVGWIPQAFVSPLSEEMADRLRNLGEEFRIPEYEAELLYDSTPPYASMFPYFIDSLSLLTSPVQSHSTSTSISSQHSRDMPYGTSKKDHNRRPYSTSRGPSRSRCHPQPPPSPSSPMPRPPSKDLSLNKPTPPTPTRPAELARTSSLTKRSIRRRPVMVDDNPTLVQLSTLLESNNTKEIDKLTSPELTGSFEALSKRTREERSQRRKASEDARNKQNINPSTPPSPPRYMKLLYGDQIVEDANGHILSASLLALVERLTMDAGTADLMSDAFTKAFLMTFRTFTTANRLFELLVDRFNMKSPKSLTDSEYKDWKANLREPMRRKVLEVFSRWLEEHRLLEEEPYIAQRLTEFLSTLLPPHDVTGNEIVKTIDRLTFAVPNRVPAVVTPKKPRKSKAHKGDLLKLDPVDIAEQLTLLESSLYVKITPQECLARARNQTGSNVARLEDFCSTHEKLCRWVKISILNNDVLNKRANTVDFWIKVAEKCRLMNNFSSMSAIIIALSSTVISKLYLTSAHVNRKSVLEALLRHNEPSGGFSGYRSLLQHAEGPCVPFITMYLTDLVHIQDQYKSDDSSQICFYQRARWHEIITNILKFQSRPYGIAPSESTTTLIESRLRDTDRDDNWFWTKSLEVQHSEVAHADIRKGLEAAGF
ncbi:hypothetical protein GALMADRAFT_54074 [Galerina marginata CBS 339.88]|uniref:Ras GEF n=1 Tax=Galerina marginata (strain CBS 339.88) TaxID=685588 RepID=A0A067U012_GALM3|nr:hypothetical protein GALMADRAFT_54074 [Galerina marginata CBS 339.88]